ncbi:hypothetical protein DERP_006668 [Dermatophagoides pteronyssinus]|uniref:Uncharacterized protein n=1 Tax=Dermatophagoides pteronyssinus TaxID=6956 RepID=A0ABQ8IQU4_DERPT|nr:hypothetical protein DERP_006668 [Dermatophagoides pteronyssinus]
MNPSLSLLSLSSPPEISLVVAVPNELGADDCGRGGGGLAGNISEQSVDHDVRRLEPTPVDGVDCCSSIFILPVGVVVVDVDTLLESLLSSLIRVRFVSDIDDDDSDADVILSLLLLPVQDFRCDPLPPPIPDAADRKSSVSDAKRLFNTVVVCIESITLLLRLFLVRFVGHSPSNNFVIFNEFIHSSYLVLQP